MGSEVTADDLRFAHDPRSEKYGLSLIEESGAIEGLNGRKVPQRINSKFKEIFELSFFSFYFEEKQDESRSWAYIVLNDQMVVSLWTDKSKLTPPVQSARIRYHPLRDMQHALGHCEICAAKNFLGRNLGESNLQDAVGRVNNIESPDTYEYSMYDFDTGTEKFDREERGECGDCQEYMADWFDYKIQENINYLWGLGGTGLLHYVETGKSKFNILDLIAGKEPITEVEEYGEVITEPDENQLDETFEADRSDEYFFNLLLGAYLSSKLGFEDYKVNCHFKSPYELSHEFDLVLIDYQGQNIVVVETSSEKKMKKNRMSNKLSAALQLESLSSAYPELDTKYFYFTTAERDSGVLSYIKDKTPYDEGLIDTICMPDCADTNIIDKTKAVNNPPGVFGNEVCMICNLMISECEFKIGRFIKSESQ